MIISQGFTSCCGMPGLFELRFRGGNIKGHPSHGFRNFVFKGAAALGQATESPVFLESRQIERLYPTLEEAEKALVVTREGRQVGLSVQEKGKVNLEAKENSCHKRSNRVKLRGFSSKASAEQGKAACSGPAFQLCLGRLEKVTL